MEHVFFLHNDESVWNLLRRLQQSTARQIVLVIPPHMERLNLILRLIRRQAAGQSQRLVVVSEDRLVQILAERMGCLTAATLDEYHGLLPGRIPSLTKSSLRFRPTSRARRLQQDTLVSSEGKAARAAPPHPSGERLKPPPEPLETGSPSLVQTAPTEQPDQEAPQKPGANLDTLLVDGYLPNPGAAPALEEAEELAAPDPEWIRYEIADESHPDQAQQESEAREANIIARIRSTSTMAPEIPEISPLTATPPQEDEPEPPAEPSPAVETTPQQKGWLRPMRSIDELIHERGHTDPFEWIAAQTAGSPPATPAGDSQNQPSPPGTGSATTTANQEQTSPQGQSPPTGKRSIGRLIQAQTRFRQRTSPPGQRTLQDRRANRPPLTAAVLFRRIGIGFILTLSLAMTCSGLALLPSAEVSYRVAVEPYSESLTLDAQPPTATRPAGTKAGTSFPAEIAQFDGVLVAQAPATGQQPAPAGSAPLFVPTQSDVDLAAGLLREQLQTLGQATLMAQIHPGDISGPVVATEEVVAFPAVGTILPDGVSVFQVSLTIHLRQVVARQQALQQAVWTSMNKDIASKKRGFTLASGQKLALNVVTSVPPAAGADLPALHLFIQAGGMIIPTLTPDQARTAIAGKSVDDATNYLRRQAGISNISINVLPKWLNRLPIFSARIRIKLES